MKKRRKTDLIVVHCAATKPDMDVGAAEIREWHRARGFSDIGYHFVIRRGGRVEPGRQHHLTGAHAKGHNASSVAICLVGGIDGDGKPDANFTDAQWVSLRKQVEDLLDIYPDAGIVGHNDLTGAKACPCFDVKAWWKGAVRPGRVRRSS